MDRQTKMNGGDRPFSAGRAVGRDVADIVGDVFKIVTLQWQLIRAELKAARSAAAAAFGAAMIAILLIGSAMIISLAGAGILLAEELGWSAGAGLLTVGALAVTAALGLLAYVKVAMKARQDELTKSKQELAKSIDAIRRAVSRRPYTREHELN